MSKNKNSKEFKQDRFSVLSFLRHHLKWMLDLFLILISFPLSLFLRVSEDFSRYGIENIMCQSVLFTFVATLAFYVFRVQKSIWRYVSLYDLFNLVKAALIGITVFWLCSFILFPVGTAFPRSIPFIHLMVLIALTGGFRTLYRYFHDWKAVRVMRADDEGKSPVVLMHTGDETDIFLRFYHQDRKTPYRIVGIIDQNKRNSGHTIRDIKVWGRLEDLGRIISTIRPRPTSLILTSDSVRGWTVRDIVEHAEKFDLEVARLPIIGQTQYLSDETIVARPIRIEDLLGRPRHNLDLESIQGLIQDQVILVTGAGGSIGGELAHQITRYRPKLLVLVDHSEFLLYELERWMIAHAPGINYKIHLGDVRDASRMNQLMKSFQPAMVFHAAALKHVPMVESNVSEGIMTNVIGTKNVADACRKHNVNIMVQISTDKVVNPKSIMGATKKLAEMYCQALDLNRSAAETKFVTVRFGNVLGSNGSVVPLFERQIQDGGPITITHPDMKRYFMTISEAVELVLLSAVLGGRSIDTGGQIFVLDMGNPVRIVDLARQMIQLKRRKAEADIEIKFTGIRKGEKLYEELFSPEESIVASGYEGVRLASSTTCSLKTIEKYFVSLEKYAKVSDTEGIIEIFAEAIPGFSPTVE